MRILAHQWGGIDERKVYDKILKHLAGEARWRERLDVLRTLEVAGWLRPAGKHARKDRLNKWTVNPQVHDGRFAKQAEAERRRLEQAKQGIAVSAQRRRAERATRDAA
jgi:hypothetical protein